MRPQARIDLLVDSVDSVDSGNVYVYFSGIGWT